PSRRSSGSTWVPLPMARKPPPTAWAMPDQMASSPRPIAGSTTGSLGGGGLRRDWFPRVEPPRLLAEALLVLVEPERVVVPVERAPFTDVPVARDLFLLPADREDEAAEP
ncbi:MAG: hypothetical protein L0G99_03175, partial [Propionibacteriales bacterium]|nr:hypothetical protein [Propionibacteriales bacterium]